jgi:hypothetical protein
MSPSPSVPREQRSRPARLGLTALVSLGLLAGLGAAPAAAAPPGTVSRTTYIVFQTRHEGRGDTVGSVFIQGHGLATCLDLSHLATGRDGDQRWWFAVQRFEQVDRYSVKGYRGPGCDDSQLLVASRGVIDIGQGTKYTVYPDIPPRRAQV